MDKVKCFKCGSMIEAAEANRVAFGTTINQRVMCKPCRKSVRDERRAELRRRKQAEYEERMRCEKEKSTWIDVDADEPKKKYKLTNAEKLVKAQERYAEIKAQKELDDLIGL